MEFRIDKKRGTPVYRQLVEEITRRVKSGELLPGDHSFRLPRCSSSLKNVS